MVTMVRPQDSALFIVLAQPFLYFVRVSEFRGRSEIIEFVNLRGRKKNAWQGDIPQTETHIHKHCDL